MIEPSAEKMLAQTLQILERDGLVTRDVVTAIPPRVEYALTPLGARVAGQVRGLVELLEAAVPEVVASRDAYDAGRA
jgi:DNA-binding HxlR family transcriptional regulator